MYAIDTEVRKSPPGYPNHEMTGRILTVFRDGSGYEVLWENNTITSESPFEIETH